RALCVLCVLGAESSVIGRRPSVVVSRIIYGGEPSMITVSPGKELLFEPTEYEARLKKVRAEMSRRELATLVVHTAQNIFYLTGYYTFAISNYQCAIVPAEGEPTLLVRSLESGNARKYSWVSDDGIVTWDDVDDPVALTVTSLQARGLGRGRIGL